MVRHIQKGVLQINGGTTSIGLSGFTNKDKMFYIPGSSTYVGVRANITSTTALTIEPGWSNSSDNRWFAYTVIETY